MNNKFEFVNCKSGFGISIQASSRGYCDPRNNTGPYTSVELGFPTAPDSLIIGYAEDVDNPTETVYGYVPVGIVQALLIKHGGIESGSIPEFEMNSEQSAILAEALFIDQNELSDLQLENIIGGMSTQKFNEWRSGVLNEEN